MATVEYFTVCRENQEAGTAASFLAVIIPQFLSCLLTLCLIMIFSAKFFLKGCYHSNAKIIVSCQMFFVSTFCGYFLTAVGKHLLNVVFKSSEECSLVQSVAECRYFYYLHIFTLCGMSITQVFLGGERVISARYVSSYENFGKKIGTAFFATAVLLAALITCFSLSEYDPSEYRLSCMGVPFSARHRSILLYIVVIVCDMLSLPMFIYTWKRSSKRDDFKGYYLGKRYQAKENLNVVKLFIPVNIAHFLMYCTYASATAILRLYVSEISQVIFPTLAMSVMLVPYYTTLELTMLNIMLRRNERKNSVHPETSNLSREAQKDIYFKELYRQWN